MCEGGWSHVELINFKRIKRKWIETVRKMHWHCYQTKFKCWKSYKNQTFWTVFLDFPVCYFFKHTQRERDRERDLSCVVFRFENQFEHKSFWWKWCVRAHRLAIVLKSPRFTINGTNIRILYIIDKNRQNSLFKYQCDALFSLSLVYPLATLVLSIAQNGQK